MRLGLRLSNILGFIVDFWSISGNFYRAAITPLPLRYISQSITCAFPVYNSSFCEVTLLNRDPLFYSEESCLFTSGPRLAFVPRIRISFHLTRPGVILSVLCRPTTSPPTQPTHGHTNRPTSHDNDNSPYPYKLLTRSGVACRARPPQQHQHPSCRRITTTTTSCIRSQGTRTPPSCPHGPVPARR